MYKKRHHYLIAYQTQCGILGNADAVLLTPIRVRDYRALLEVICAKLAATGVVLDPEDVFIINIMELAGP